MNTDINIRESSLHPLATRVYRRISFVLACALTALPQSTVVLASDPDTSNRSRVEYPYYSSSSDLFQPSTVSYVSATAAANNDAYALLGAGTPRHTILVNCSGDTPFCGGLVVSVDFEANPIHVVGPWDGSVSSTELIAPPTNPLGVEHFGSSLAIQGSRIAVGASSVFSWTYSVDEYLDIIPSTTPTAGGRVHLYQINGSTITPEQTIVHGGLEEMFGASLALDASHLLVGRPGASPGAADLFSPNTGALITSLSSPASLDGFGQKVALAGELAIVAAPDSNTVYVYRHDGSGNWNPAGTLDSPGAGSEFGVSLDADGEQIIVGAPALDRAYIYEDDGDAIWPVAAELSGGATSRFGTAVAIVGEVAFVSAPELPFSGFVTGLVVRHEKSGGSWPFTGFVNSGQPNAGNSFGALISASSTMLTVLDNGGGLRPEKYNIYTAPHLIWDTDGDGVVQFLDNCTGVSNSNQNNYDGDAHGDACDIDQDNDGVWNPDELAQGSDPLNPDTDGDGMDDGEDPDPLVSDLDRDGVGDDEEIAAGTDPLDPDTDDDGRDDGEDPFPLDPYDGWLLIEQIYIEHSRIALGSDVLLALNSDGETQAWSRETGVWATIPNPTLNSLPLSTIARIRMNGDRAVYVEKNPSGFTSLFHVFDYSNGSWSWQGTGNTSAALGALSNIWDIAVDGNTIGALVSSSGVHSSSGVYKTIVFEVGSGTVLPNANHITGFGELTASGDTVFVGTPTAYSGEGAILILEPSNSYVPQEIRRPQNERDITDNLGEKVSAAGPNEILAGSQATGFWLSKIAGNWELNKVGLPRPEFWPTTGYWIGGGDRKFVINGLFDWLVYDGLTKAFIGTLHDPAYATSARRMKANGDIIAQGREVYNGQDYIKIYHPVVQPPGC